MTYTMEELQGLFDLTNPNFLFFIRQYVVKDVVCQDDFEYNI